MAIYDNRDRWWLRSGEIAFVFDGAARWELVFLWDNGSLWGFDLVAPQGKKTRVIWGHRSGAMTALEDVPPAIEAQLPEVLHQLRGRPAWDLRMPEQSVIDVLVQGRSRQPGGLPLVSGRSLRARLHMDGETLKEYVQQLEPKFLKEAVNAGDDHFTPSLVGLFASSEREMARRVIDATLAVFRQRYGNDPDVRDFRLSEVLSCGGFEEQSRPFVSAVVNISFFPIGSISDEHFNMPDDIEALARLNSCDGYLRMLNDGHSTRPWLTAPIRMVSHGAPVVTTSPAPPSSGSVSKYDVALSFAGEDRAHAEALASVLKNKGVRVFYDDDNQAALWGTNLLDLLHDVYCNQATFCVMFVSAHYARKLWTSHERQAAQARAFRERGKAYILPVRIDGTQLPGLPETIGYMSITEGTSRIADALLVKLGRTSVRI